jgi:hypothetical protein
MFRPFIVLDGLDNASAALHGGADSPVAHGPGRADRRRIGWRLTSQRGPSVRGSWPQPEKPGGRCLAWRSGRPMGSVE